VRREEAQGSVHGLAVGHEAYSMRKAKEMIGRIKCWLADGKHLDRKSGDPKLSREVNWTAEKGGRCPVTLVIEVTHADVFARIISVLILCCRGDDHDAIG
jgi:hypothetical protein